MRPVMLMTCLIFVGCQIDFTGSGGAVSTTSPTAEQIAYCRDVMYINPELDLEPLGYFMQPGMDDVIRFKFIAKVNDPSLLFDAYQVDASKFSSNFRASALDTKAKDKWWDVSSQALSGGNFSVPPPNRKGARGLNIGYINNDDETLTVYVLWHET